MTTETTNEPLARCDAEILKNGQQVFVTHSIPSEQIEAWVKRVAEKSGQPVDWGYCCGRAVVWALGDLDKVADAIRDLMPEHDKLLDEAYASYGIKARPR